MASDLAKLDDTVYESDSDSDKLTVDLTRQLQITALAKQLGIPTADLDVDSAQKLKSLVKDSNFPALFIGSPMKPRVDQMATYVNKLDDLINFNPALH